MDQPASCACHHAIPACCSVLPTVMHSYGTESQNEPLSCSCQGANNQGRRDQEKKEREREGRKRKKERKGKGREIISLTSSRASHNAWENHCCYYSDDLAPSKPAGFGAQPVTGHTRFTAPEEPYRKSRCHFENTKKQTTHNIIEQVDEQISPSS